MPHSFPILERALFCRSSERSRGGSRRGGISLTVLREILDLHFREDGYYSLRSIHGLCYPPFEKRKKPALSEVEGMGQPPPGLRLRRQKTSTLPRDFVDDGVVFRTCAIFDDLAVEPFSDTPAG